MTRKSLGKNYFKFPPLQKLTADDAFCPVALNSFTQILKSFASFLTGSSFIAIVIRARAVINLAPRPVAPNSHHWKRLLLEHRFVFLSFPMKINYLIQF